LPTVRHPKYCVCLKITLITLEDSPRILQERIIENLDARFHQHQLCFTCEKPVWRSGIIVGELKELQEQADVSLPRWQGGMRRRLMEESINDIPLSDGRVLEETIEHY
jgi:hypothetical protein